MSLPLSSFENLVMDERDSSTPNENCWHSTYGKFSKCDQAPPTHTHHTRFTHTYMYIHHHITHTSHTHTHSHTHTFTIVSHTHHTHIHTHTHTHSPSYHTQGHCRPGKVQDNHNCLLQGSNGECVARVLSHIFIISHSAALKSSEN